MGLKGIICLLPLLYCGASWGQTITGECGGPIKCPVGSLCTSIRATNVERQLKAIEDISTTTEDSGSSTNGIDTTTGAPSTSTEIPVRDCTENAACEDNVCTCGQGFMATSYGFCLPTFNSSCLESQCNEEALLICSEVTRRCVCPFQVSHFSEMKGECVGGSGSSCSQSMTCTDNAFCNFMFDWKCHCDGGFSKTSGGQCRPSFGSPCSANVSLAASNCNADEFLRCADKKCVCDEGRVYDENIGGCASLVRGQCDLKVTTDMFQVSFCVSGARCTPSIQGNLTDTRSGSCQCPTGLSETSDKMCASSSLVHVPVSSLILLLLLSIVRQQ